MDYLDTLRLIVLNPEQFLKELEKEEKAGPAAVFLIVSAFLNSFFIIIMYYMFFFGVSLYVNRSSSDFRVWNFTGPLILGTIIFTILALIAWILYIVLVHLLAFLFNRNIRFLRTFQIVAYGSATYFLFSLIPIFGLLSIFYTIYIVAIGIAKFHKLEMPKAVAVAIIPPMILILFILLIIFSIFMTLTRIVDPY